MPDINMSPMVDMIFLLLIFFMVTAVFTKDAGLGINRPQAQTAQPLPQEPGKFGCWIMHIFRVDNDEEVARF